MQMIVDIATAAAAAYLIVVCSVASRGLFSNNPFPLDTWPAKAFGQRGAEAMRAELMVGWVAMAIILVRGAVALLTAQGISVIWE